MAEDVVTYMTEQYPDILDAYEDSVLQDGQGSEYLAGVVDAYEHLMNKFGSYERP